MQNIDTVVCWPARTLLFIVSNKTKMIQNYKIFLAGIILFRKILYLNLLPLGEHKKTDN